MAGLRILATGSALPESVLSNTDLEAIVETDDAWIRSRTGIRTRRIARRESTADLAFEAACRAIDELDGRLDPRSVRVLICATLSPDDYTPSCACQVQKRLGWTHELCAFDLNGACSGFLFALKSAFGLIAPGERALVIGAERISSFLDWTDRSTCVLFGDGAGAVIMEKDADAPCTWYARTIPDEKMLLHASRDETLQMKGSGVFRFALEAMETVYDVCVRQQNVLNPVPDLIIPHQANLRILRQAARNLQIDPDRFFTNLDHTGNTSAASVPIALDEAARRGFLQPGMSILLAGFGAGLSMSGVYFRWNPLSRKEAGKQAAPMQHKGGNDEYDGTDR